MNRDKFRVLWHSVAGFVRCYSSDTEVLTENGWKFLKDVSLDERIMTLNPETFDMEYEKPLEKFEYDWNGDMYHLDTKQIDLLVTPNHKMFIAKRQRNNSLIWRFEDAIFNLNKSVTYLKTGKWKGNEPKYMEISYCSTNGKLDKKRRIKTEDFVEFMGYFLSDGYIDHKVYNSNYTIGIRQVKKENLKKMGNSLSKVSKGEVYYYPTKVIARDKGLHQYLLKFGYSYEKYIPKDIKELSPKLLKIFLKAFMLGDGNKKSSSYFTSSINLRDDLQEIIIKSGNASTYSLFNEKGKEGNFGVSNYDNWRIKNSKARRTVKINDGVRKKVDHTEKYSGKVYCLDVSNDVLLVRRNGKPVFCGNSGYGNVTRSVTSRLVQRGYDIIVSAYYGLEPGGTMKIEGVPHLPSKMGRFGEQSCKIHAKGLNPDLTVLHSDWWAFCISEDTEILTSHGWKIYKEIDENEEIATFNTETSEIEFQNINKKFVYDHFKEVLHLYTKQIDLLLTPEHSIVYRGKKSQKNNGKWLRKSINDFKSLTTYYIPVSSYCDKNRDLGISDEFAWFLGFMMAEGTFREYDSRVYQSIKHKEINAKLRKVLSNIDPNFGEYIDERNMEIEGYKTSPTIQFQIHAKPTRDIKKWFKNLNPKRFIDEILFCSEREFKNIIKGWVDGDGWEENRGNSIQIVTSDEVLRDFLQTFSILHSRRCTWYEREKGDFCVTISSKNYATFVGKNSIEKKLYNGVTWCVNVPNGTIIVRRNGRHAIIGNSWFPQMPYPSLCYSPMDHINYPEELLNLTRKYDYVFALCKFQLEELKKNGITSTLVPHGVDTKVYHPIPGKEARKMTKFPLDKFVIGRVAANSDKEDRKMHSRCFVAIRLFLENNPDARKDLAVYWHSNSMDQRGLNLSNFVHKQGLDNIVRFTDPAMTYVRLSDEEMCLLYNSFDIQLYPSSREGFGLPIIEADACGVPNIVTDFSSMPELVDYGKCGWMVKNLVPDDNIITTPINACTSLPDVYDIADKIEDAYNHPKKVIKFGSKARSLAIDYDWDRVIDKYWIPALEDIQEDLKPKTIEDRKLV